jgi:hypothetical protein
VALAEALAEARRECAQLRFDNSESARIGGAREDAIRRLGAVVGAQREALAAAAEALREGEAKRVLAAAAEEALRAALDGAAAEAASVEGRVASLRGEVLKKMRRPQGEAVVQTDPPPLADVGVEVVVENADAVSQCESIFSHLNGEGSHVGDPLEVVASVVNEWWAEIHTRSAADESERLASFRMSLRARPPAEEAFENVLRRLRALHDAHRRAVALAMAPHNTRINEDAASSGWARGGEHADARISVDALPLSAADAELSRAVRRRASEVLSLPPQEFDEEPLLRHIEARVEDLVEMLVRAELRAAEAERAREVAEARVEEGVRKGVRVWGEGS